MDLTNKQFNKFSQLVYRESGISLHDGKKQLLQARLAKRLRQTQIDSIDDYFELINTDVKELVAFLDAVSTNHTFFFRESHNLEYLDPTQLKIWCAASSSGEEPYSIAIHCLEMGFKPQILATDISTHMLKTGLSGIYTLEKARLIPPDRLKRYFLKGHGKWDGYIRVKDELRKMVTFERFNLVSDTPKAKEYDTIFCRNVMIYFDNAVKERVLQKLNGVLKISGYFVIGGAESLNNLNHRLKYIRPSIYQKVVP